MRWILGVAGDAGALGVGKEGEFWVRGDAMRRERPFGPGFPPRGYGG